MDEINIEWNNMEINKTVFDLESKFLNIMLGLIIKRCNLEP